MRRFLGMTNQLSKFSPKLAETSKPLRDLLSKKNMWSWGVPQRNSFNEMKRILSSDVAVLALYDPEADSLTQVRMVSEQFSSNSRKTTRGDQ